MPITGKFVGDFDDFNRAVQQAEVQLRGFETESSKVDKSLNRMADSFSGRKVIQEALLMEKAIAEIGGASKLTEAELARVGATASEAVSKMRAIGMDVPKGLDDLATKTGSFASTAKSAFAEVGSYIAGAFTVGAVVNFGKAVLDAGDQIQQMADQTGMATDEVQAMMHIAGQTAVPVTSLTSAMQGLQDSLGSDSEGTIGALKFLGINLDELKTKSPYEQMVAIAEKLREIKDPTEQAALAADVFGKNWKSILPAIKGGMEEIGAAAPKMSKEAVEGLDAIGDSFATLKEYAIIGAAEFLKAGQDMVAGTADWLSALNPEHFGTRTSTLMKSYVAENDKLVASLGTVAPAADKAAAGVTRYADAKKKAEEDAKKAKEAAQEEERKLKAEEEKRRKDFEEWTGAYERVAAAGTDWRATIAANDPQLVEHVQSLIRAGRSLDDLAKAYSLPIDTIKDFARGVTETDKVLKLHDAALRETAKLQEDLYALQSAHAGTAVDAQIAEIDRWANHYTQRLMDAGTLTTESEKLIADIRQQKIDDLLVSWQTVDAADEKRHTDAVAREQRTLDYMLQNQFDLRDGSLRFTQAAIDDQRAVLDAAIATAEGWAESSAGAADRVINDAHRARDEHKRAAQETVTSWSQAMDLVRQGQGVMSGTLAPPDTSSPYWNSPDHVAKIQQAWMTGRYFGPALGSRPGDLPGTSKGAQVDWGAIGMSTPPGQFSAGQLTSGIWGRSYPQVVNNFQVNGTGKDVARVVLDEINRSMKTGRKWPAV